MKQDTSLLEHAGIALFQTVAVRGPARARTSTSAVPHEPPGEGSLKSFAMFALEGFGIV